MDAFFYLSVLLSIILGLGLTQHLAFHALMAAGCALGLVLRRRRFHEVIGLTFAAAIVAYIGTLFTHLS